MDEIEAIDAEITLARRHLLELGRRKRALIIARLPPKPQPQSQAKKTDDRIDKALHAVRLAAQGLSRKEMSDEMRVPSSSSATRYLDIGLRYVLHPTRKDHPLRPDAVRVTQARRKGVPRPPKTRAI